MLYLSGIVASPTVLMAQISSSAVSILPKQLYLAFMPEKAACVDYLAL